MKRLFALFSSSALGVSALSANILLNGGFDDYTNGNGDINSRTEPTTSWFEGSGGTGDPQTEGPVSRGITAHSGNAFMIFAGGVDGASILQTFTTVANTTYELKFWVARPNTNGTVPVLGVDVFSGTGDTDISNPGDLLDEEFPYSTAEYGGDTFHEFTFEFTATTEQTTLRFADPGPAPNVDLSIDTVSIVATTDDDNDGLPDAYEQQIIDADAGDAVDGLDDVAGPNDAPTTTDFDGDGASDADEFANETDPLDEDSDDDGLLDGVETNTGEWVDASDRGTDPHVQDSDDDGLLDNVENPDMPFMGPGQTGSDPNDPESDGDGLRDGFEILAGLDPSTDDTDGNGTLDNAEDGDEDGLDNLGEQTAGSDPTDNDSDDDRLLDGAEVNTHNSSPTDTDSDGDGIADGDEVEGVNPSGFTSDPSLPDTDNDGVVDPVEIAVGTDPRDPTQFPEAAPDLSWTAEGLTEGNLATWDPAVNGTGNAAITFNQNTGGTVQTGPSNFSNLGAWVSAPGYNLAGNPGDSWQDALGGAATQENVTWEIVFRPGDYDGTHTLFNTGGNGDGTAFTLVGSTVEFRFQDADSDAQRVIVSTDLSLIGPPTDFYHVVGVADVDTAAAGTGSLYVNGVLVDGPVTSTGTINDWDGGDLAELGKGGNIPAGNPSNAVAFTGDIAVFNYFGGDLLNADIIESRYQAFSGGGTNFEITEVQLLPGNQLQLTWNSRPGAVYSIFYSTDGIDFSSDANDSVDSQGDSTTYTVDSFSAPIGAVPTLLFKVSEN